MCNHPNCKWQINDTYHWKECSDCDGQISEIHDFDMSGSGKRDVRCKVCGYKLSVLGSCKDVYGITYELQSNGEAYMKEQDYARETIIIPEEVYDSVGQAYKVTRICGNALKFQNGIIKTVIISKNVNYIDEYAFAGCKGLERLVFLPGSAFKKESSTKLSWKTFWHCNANVKVCFHEATNNVIKNKFSRAIGRHKSKLEFHTVRKNNSEPQSGCTLNVPKCFKGCTLECSGKEILIPPITHECRIEKQTAISTVYRCVHCKKGFTVNTPKNGGDLFNTNLIDCLSTEDLTRVIGDDRLNEDTKKMVTGGTIEMKIEEKPVSQVKGASKNAMCFDITFTYFGVMKITEFKKPVKIKLSLGKHNPRGAELWCWHDEKPFKIKNFDVEEKNGKFWIIFESKQFSIYEIRGVCYTIDDSEIIKNDDGSFTVKIKEDLSDRDEMRAESKLLQNILSSGSKVYIVDDKENKFEIIENSVDEDGKLMTLKFREVLLEDPIEVEQEEVNTTMDQVTDNFKTGDTNNIAFLITLMFLALTLGSLTVRKKKFEK